MKQPKRKPNHQPVFPVCNHKLSLLGLKKYGYNRWYCPKCRIVYLEIPLKMMNDILKELERITSGRKLEKT